MKKKYLSVTSYVKGEKCDVFSQEQTTPQDLLAIMQLAPVGTTIDIEVKEMELPDMSLNDIHPHS